MEIAVSRLQVQRFCYEAEDQRERNHISSPDEPWRESQKSYVSLVALCIPVRPLTERASSKTSGIQDKLRFSEDIISSRPLYITQKTMIETPILIFFLNPFSFLLHNPFQNKPYCQVTACREEDLGRTACSRRHGGSQPLQL